MPTLKAATIKSMLDPVISLMTSHSDTLSDEYQINIDIKESRVSLEFYQEAESNHAALSRKAFEDEITPHAQGFIAGIRQATDEAVDLLPCLELALAPSEGKIVGDLTIRGDESDFRPIKQAVDALALATAGVTMGFRPGMEADSYLVFIDDMEENVTAHTPVQAAMIAALLDIEGKTSVPLLKAAQRGTRGALLRALEDADGNLHVARIHTNGELLASFDG